MVPNCIADNATNFLTSQAKSHNLQRFFRVNASYWPLKEKLLNTIHCE